jgi:hypothetical protein
LREVQGLTNGRVLASARGSNGLIEDREFEHGAELNWLCAPALSLRR